MNNTKIYLIAGKARSGKDTAQEIINEYYQKQNKKIVKLGFTDYIKNYAKKIKNWDGKEETKPREFLQTLGTDIIRNKINKDFFINRLCEDIEVYKNFFDVIIISGARFPNELEKPKQKFKNVTTIKIERPNYQNELTEKQKSHITEHALDNYTNFDYTIINNKDIKHLQEKIEKILKER